MTVCSFLVIFGLGWFTSIRVIAASGLVSAGSVALLPLVIVAIGLCLLAYFMFMSVFMAYLELVPGSGEPVGWRVLLLGFSFFGPYYNWLLHKDRAGLWGAMMGLILSVLVLVGILLLHVIPRESATAVLLVEVGERLQRIESEQGAFPVPNTDGTLSWEHVTLPDAHATRTGIIEDYFGNPILIKIEPYKQHLDIHFGILSEEKPKVFRPGSFERFTIHSNGFSALDQTDDIEYSGVSNKAEPITTETIRGALTQLVYQKAKASASDRLKALRMLRKKKKEDS